MFLKLSRNIFSCQVFAKNIPLYNIRIQRSNVVLVIIFKEASS